MTDLKGVELSFHTDESTTMMADSTRPIPNVPKETARAANAIFGRSNFHILIGEHLETILEDIHLEDPERGGISNIEGTTLAMITFFQFFEGLTDTQAVDAVRTRIDWKFALHLPLTPATFREGPLCEFRQRILSDSVGEFEFQKLIDRLARCCPSVRNNFQNLKSLDVTSFVCSVNRLNRAQQAMHQALEVLAARFPDWLRKVALPHWYGRYNHATPRLEVAMLLGQQRFFMEEIGADIHHLTDEIDGSGSKEMGELPEIKTLKQLWSQQFHAPNLPLNPWPEKLTLDHCNTCPYKAAGRRS